jgi:hypothetical protein
VLIGNIAITTPVVHELMRRGIPVSWYSSGDWFLGHTTGTGHKNVELRTAQYRVAAAIASDSSAAAVPRPHSSEKNSCLQAATNRAGLSLLGKV